MTCAMRTLKSSISEWLANYYYYYFKYDMKNVIKWLDTAMLYQNDAIAHVYNKVLMICACLPTLLFWNLNPAIFQDK